ncbi:MAG: hypothetical protein ABSH20_04325 [Tepidisphaeraceae bacterium]|jgi:hypothetical protein
MRDLMAGVARTGPRYNAGRLAGVFMEPTLELIDVLRRDKIDAAQRMSPERKLLAGAELFETVCEIARAGIRMQHPGITEPGVREQLRWRLSFLHRQEIAHERR